MTIRVPGYVSRFPVELTAGEVADAVEESELFLHGDVPAARATAQAAAAAWVEEFRVAPNQAAAEAAAMHAAADRGSTVWVTSTGIITEAADGLADEDADARVPELSTLASAPPTPAAPRTPVADGLLGVCAAVLGRGQAHRYREEWAAELHDMCSEGGSRWARARFVAGVVFSLRGLVVESRAQARQAAE